jgi:hypothetical protein
MLSRITLLFALGASAAIAAFPVAAQEKTGMQLESAGFVMRPANTPEKMKHLRSLPAHKFVRRRKADGTYYIYADPDYCRCAYVGTEQAMNSYRDMISPPKPPPGVRDFEGVPSRSVQSLDSLMIQDMEDDGAPPGEAYLFHPGF